MTQIQPLPDPNRFEPRNLNPVGLNQLSQLDSIYVQQKVELLEALTGCERNNRYVITDSSGALLFKAHESTDCLTRQCCGPLRPFELFLTDVTNDEPVIQFSRPLACGDCCFPCCLQTISIYSPPGELVGSVEQVWSLCSPKFIVKSENGETLFGILGPFCTLACCKDVEFQIVSGDMNKDNQIGRISKKWGGLTREALTDADIFGVHFPTGINTKLKATLLGALFLIDFMYFEHNQ